MAAPFGSAGDQKYPLVKYVVEAFGGMHAGCSLFQSFGDKSSLVNIIVVVGHEKLNVEMQRLFGTYTSTNPNITIVKIPKSGGVGLCSSPPRFVILTMIVQVVEIDHAYRERLHAHQLRTYFYGTTLFLPKNMTEASANLGGEASTELTLSPYSSAISFDDILIYRIGGGESIVPFSL